MSLQVIEGTWEEIKRREAELAGQRLRVTIMPQGPATRKPRAPATKGSAAPTEPKVLRAWGMLAGIISTEDYFREKREEMLLEDRPR